MDFRYFSLPLTSDVVHWWLKEKNMYNLRDAFVCFQVMHGNELCNSLGQGWRTVIVGQIQPASCFCKLRFAGTQPCSSCWSIFWSSFHCTVAESNACSTDRRTPRGDKYLPSALLRSLFDPCPVVPIVTNRANVQQKHSLKKWCVFERIFVPTTLLSTWEYKADKDKLGHGLPGTSVQKTRITVSEPFLRCRVNLKNSQWSELTYIASCFLVDPH